MVGPVAVCYSHVGLPFSYCRSRFGGVLFLCLSRIGILINMYVLNKRNLERLIGFISNQVDDQV